MIRAVIFDCFGVIRPDILPRVYEKFGGNYEADRQFIDDTLNAAHRGMIPGSRYVFAEHLGVSVEDWIAEFASAAKNDQMLLDYIQGLRSQYKTAVLSNTSKGHLAELLGEDTLARCFDIVAESGTLGMAKPQPEIYEYTANKLEVKPDECVFIDDREFFCEAARAVGMQAIQYISFKQFKADFEEMIKGSRDA